MSCFAIATSDIHYLIFLSTPFNGSPLLSSLLLLCHVCICALHSYVQVQLQSLESANRQEQERRAKAEIERVVEGYLQAFMTLQRYDEVTVTVRVTVTVTVTVTVGVRVYVYFDDQMKVIPFICYSCSVLAVYII